MIDEKEIIINGITYIKKEPKTQKKVTRFKISEELKLLKIFKKVFSNESENPIDEDYCLENGIYIVDPANVILCEGKSERAKRFLSRFTDNDASYKPKKPELDYKLDLDKFSSARFNVDYLLTILECFKIIEESCKITLKNDYPVTLENKDFKFILAPRIDSEDN